ncbi:MAG: carbon-nitrogen hydrolase family protein [Oscillospiraceae bacterium]
MKIALAQMKMSSDMDENLNKSLELIRSAAENGADIICFPEVQLSPFFAQYKGKDAAEYLITEDSRYVKEIRTLCRESKIYAAPNFYISENGRNYDMSLLIDDKGEIIGRQKMVHIAQCENFYEQDYYTPSEEGFRVFDTKFGKIGIVVCFDRHYPESIRTQALKGADLIIIPTANTKSEPSEMFIWEIKVQAYQNSVNIAMCNRVGVEDKMEFSGESIVADHNGNTVLLADDSEGLFMTDISLSDTAQVRSVKPYTSLRRKELYES